MPVDERAVRLALLAAHYRTELEQTQELIRIIAMDYGDQCDHPDDCTCSMAQAVRYAHTLNQGDPEK